MRILLTNDDGINSKGLWSLAEGLSQVAEVTICAPDREQSGISSAVSLHHPVRVCEVMSRLNGIKAYSVEGTPADSVILALETLIKDGPSTGSGYHVDAVFSGINEGSNLGDDVLLSGTVGAAWQGYFRGIPSVALSVTALKDVQFDAAVRLGQALAVAIGEGALTGRLLLNVNVPNLSLDKIEGIEITRMGKRSYTDQVRQGDDGRREWFWIYRGKPAWRLRKGTDIWAIRKKRISLTPLGTGLTEVSQLRPLASMTIALRERLGLGNTTPT